MGFKPTLTVKHATDGYSFQIDIDRDADILGIKVLIWELQKVPVDAQHIVFEGKELTDAIKISSTGIVDGDIIFLIEKKIEDATTTLTTSYVEPIEIPSTSSSSFADTLSPVVFTQKIEILEAPVQLQHDTTVDEHYVSLMEQVDESRVDGVVVLSCMIRAYLWTGLMITLLSTFMYCIFSLLPLSVYVVSLFAARKLNKWLLILPLILTVFVGFGGIFFNLLWFVSITQFCIGMIIPVIHMVLAALLLKLILGIAQLNHTEYKQARARVVSRSCCCF